jgi:hypothetical protein
VPPGRLAGHISQGSRRVAVIFPSICLSQQRFAKVLIARLGISNRLHDLRSLGASAATVGQAQVVVIVEIDVPRSWLRPS